MIKDISKGRKAQFFIIATILISLVVFVAADMMQGYHSIEFNQIRNRRIPFLMYNLEDKINRSKAYSGSPSPQEGNLVEFIKFVKRDRGYLLDIEVGPTTNVTINASDFDLRKEID